MNAPAPSSGRAPKSLRPGTFLGDKYRVERVLGQGGMGIVVAAMHLHLRQRVAIKMLLPEIARDEKVVARFLQEARAQVRIQGDHVVRVLDVASLPCGSPMMVMELLNGRDLSGVMEERGHLPAAEAIDYLLQACEAIAQAHSLGIVHRDLKPQNMFLTSAPDGMPLVKVLDFGISKTQLLSDATRRAGATTEGGILGSPAYMSPEQIKNPKLVTQRSDIWSLGVILYELLTGEMPFMSTTLGGLFAAITSEPPVDIRSRRNDLPDSVVSAIMRCLSREPEHRPRDVAEFAMALVIDASSRARALRIESIVKYFEAMPPPSLPVNSTAMGPTLADGSSATLFAKTEEDRRDPLQWASTVHERGRTTRRRRSSAGIGIGLVAAALLAACGAIGALTLTRSSAQGPGAQSGVQTQTQAQATAPVVTGHADPPPIAPVVSAAAAAATNSSAAAASTGSTARTKEKPPILVRGRAGKIATPPTSPGPGAAPAPPAPSPPHPSEGDLYDSRK